MFVKFLGWVVLETRNNHLRSPYIIADASIAIDYNESKARFPLPELTARVNGPS